MTSDDIRDFSRRINSLVIAAKNQEEMYRKLNTLRTNGHAEWQLLRSPCWVGNKLIAVVVRPDHEYIAELDARAINGNC